MPVFALSAVLAGCTQNPPEDPAGKEKVTIHASVESTRTSLGDDLSVVWSEGDTFYLLGANGNGELFSIVSGAGTNDASFEGYKPAGNSFVAAYPAERVFVSDDKCLGMTFPATQTYMRGSFAESANPMIATATGDVSEMFFRNLCGLLELQITGSGTLSSITLSSGSPMAGSAIIDYVDLWGIWQPDLPGYGQSLEITGIDEELSTSEPLSVYCVLPPGEYDSLEVRMTDSEGNTVTKTASQPVVVDRSKVTPVTGLVFENAVQAPVSITIDESKSNFKRTNITFALTGSAEANGIMYWFDTKKCFDRIMSTNPQATVFDLLMASGHAAPSIPYTAEFPTYPGLETVFLAMALGPNMEYEVVRMDYTNPAINDTSLNLTDERVAFTCTENSIDVTVSLPAGAKRLQKLMLIGSALEGADDTDLCDQILFYRPNCGVDVEGETYTTGATGLIPDTKYAWLFVVEGENGFGELYKAEVYTKEHVSSAASIAIMPMSISDVTAEFDIGLNDASTYKLVAVPAMQLSLNVDLSDENALAAYIDSAEGYVFSADETTVSLPVKPSTDYVVLGLAYDAAGVYGRPTYAEFTTEYPIPGDDTPEYRQFIGRWKVSYTDLEGREPVEMIVSVREHVVGKTYLVSGMMDPAYRMRYSIDDEILARFEDGKIVLDGMTPVQDCGSLSENYVVSLFILRRMVDGNLSGDVTGESIYGEKLGSDIVFTCSSQEYVGISFFAELLPYRAKIIVLGAYGDVVWQPYLKSANTGNTESFESNPSVNPGWH